MHESLYPGMLKKESLSAENTVGVIFCGGKGTRLRDVTREIIPKHLLPLSNETTILDSIVHSLRSAGIDHILLITTQSTEEHIQAHIKSKKNLYDCAQVIQNPNKDKNGMGSVLEQIQRQIPLTKTIIKMDGDTVHVGLPIQNMLQFHESHKAPLTVALTNKGNFTHTVTLDPDKDQIIDVDNDQVTESTDIFGLTGTWIIDPSYIQTIIECPDTTSFLKRVSHDKSIKSFVFDGPSININTPRDYALAQILRT